MGKLQEFAFDLHYVRFLWTLRAARKCSGKFRSVLTSDQVHLGIVLSLPLPNQFYSIAIKPLLCLFWREKMGLVFHKLGLLVYTVNVLYLIQDVGDPGHVEAHKKKSQCPPPRWSSCVLMVGVRWRQTFSCLYCTSLSGPWPTAVSGYLCDPLLLSRSGGWGARMAAQMGQNS